MVPEKGAHAEELDERLVEARDEVLLAGERIVAQEAGDQGQAIVLTDSRIIILKAGITATGTLNGRKVSICPYGNITKISVRKGPMGAVIQVCGSETKLTPGERPPENLVVFSGADKVKRCDAITLKIEEMTGTSVDRIQAGPQVSPAPVTAANEAPEKPAPKKRAPRKSAAPKGENVEAAIAPEPVVEAGPEVVEKVEEPEPPKRRGGRVAKTLAEEMFGDMTAAPPVAAPPPAPAVAEVQIEETKPEPVVEILSQTEPEPTADVISEPEPAPVFVAEVAPEPEPEPVVEPSVEVIPEIKTEAVEDYRAEAVPEPLAAPVEIMQEVPEETVVAAVEPEPVAEVSAEPEVIAELEPEVIAEPEPQFRPNPNLPKPGRRKSGSSKVLAGIGILAACVYLGMAVMGPTQQKPLKNVATINLNQVTTNVSLVRAQYQEILAYNAKVQAAIRKSDASVAAVRSAVGSGNSQAIASAVGRDVTDDVLTEVSALTVPLGLAGAQENLEAGLFMRKAAVENAAASSAETNAKLGDADAKIRQASSAIQAMIADLTKKLTRKPGK